MLFAQLGFGIAQDLAAIRLGVDPSGTGCTAVVHSFIDLHILSKQLQRRLPALFPKVEIFPLAIKEYMPELLGMTCYPALTF